MMAPPISKPRRVTLIIGRTLFDERTRRPVDRPAYARIGAAPADIGDPFVDLAVARMRRGDEQRRRCRDHARLAIAALRHLLGDPRLLQLRRDPDSGGKTFDGGDVGPGGIREPELAAAFGP